MRARAYVRPDDRRATWQVLNSAGPFLLVWYSMYESLRLSYALTLVLAVPAAGFLLRIFVLQHDLGHGSLFRSRRINDGVGALFGMLTLIPYRYWRRTHGLHHSHFGNLDRRGPGYLTTLTVNEWRALPASRRLLYRLYRNPWIVLGLGGLYYFLVQHRMWYDAPRHWPRERRSVHLTNLSLVLVALALATRIGWRPVLLVHLPILYLFSVVAVWVFLNQHSFEDCYWEKGESWDFVRSSLEGSSYYKLPRVLQWFTANVGFHHVHHLSPKVPNYNLERCHRALPELQSVPPLSLRQSLRTLRWSLWCEDGKKMVSFRDALRGGAGR